MRRLKTIVVAVVGFTILLIGAAMLVLPGPGLIVIAFGLLVLSAEFVWAKRALNRMKDQAQKMRDRWGPASPGKQDAQAARNNDSPASTSPGAGRPDGPA